MDVVAVAIVVVAAAVDVVVAAVVGAEVGVATFVVAVGGSAYDSVVVAYSAGEISYRYRRRNFSKSHLHRVSCSACSGWRICRCLVRACVLGCCYATEAVRGCAFHRVASSFEHDDGASELAVEESTRSSGSVLGGPKCAIR